MTKISSKGMRIGNQKCNTCLEISVPSWLECRKGGGRQYARKKERRLEEDAAMIPPFHGVEIATQLEVSN